MLIRPLTDVSVLAATMPGALRLLDWPGAILPGQSWPASHYRWIVSDRPGSRCSRTLMGTTTVDRAIGRCLVCDTRLVVCFRHGPEMIERFRALVGGRCPP